MRIQILVDNPNSWIIPYVQKLVELLSKSHQCVLIKNQNEIQKGDILILLACEKKLKNELRLLNKNNFCLQCSISYEVK